MKPQTILRSISVLLIVSVLSLLAGCGGGSGRSSIASPQSSGAEQPFAFGALTGRAAISSPPLTTTSAASVITGLKGSITELILKDSAPTLAETQIVFTSQRHGNDEIYVMNPDGSNPTRLTNTPWPERDPAWSPDRAKIAFVSARDGNLEIYVMNADGSNQTRLTHSNAEDTSPAWSPDGSKIAFVSNRDNPNREIYTMNPDGTGVIRLTSNNTLDSSPSWSPDGTKIAFVTDRAGNDEIYVMSADGSNPTRLTNTGAQEFYPAWSPDGSKIAFVSRRDGDYEIYVMNASGANQTRLTHTNTSEASPTWSPDGTKIAFSNVGSDSNIYIMNADGSGETVITSNPSSDFNPSWSPFVRQRQIIGGSGLLGQNAGGFLFSQHGDTVRSILTFDAVSRDSIVLTQQTGLNQIGPNLVFSVDADQLNSLAYTNNPDYKPVGVVGTGSAVKIAAGALISYNAQTGRVAAVLPFSGGRAAGGKSSVSASGR